MTVNLDFDDLPPAFKSWVDLATYHTLHGPDCIKCRLRSKALEEREETLAQIVDLQSTLIDYADQVGVALDLKGLKETEVEKLLAENTQLKRQLADFQ